MDLVKHYMVLHQLWTPDLSSESLSFTESLVNKQEPAATVQASKTESLHKQNNAPVQSLSRANESKAQHGTG